VLWTFAALAAYAAIEGALFRGGLYTPYLEPNSTTGQTEYHLYWLRHAAPVKVPQVLVVGDSRIGEGFSARDAEKAVSGREHFINFGVPGSSLRVWYYLIRDADPGRNRFSQIVLALDHFTDEDWGEDPRDRLSDMNYLAGRLRLADCYDFAKSFADQKLRRGILTQCYIRGIPFRADVQSFLKDIPDRLTRTQDWRANGMGYVDGYGGKPEDLTGLTVDREKHEIHFPPNLQDWQTTSIRHTVFPDAAPQTGALSKYRKKWLGRILDLYKGSSTKIVLIQIPRAPWQTPDSKVPRRFIDSVAANPNLKLLPADTFQDLERPEVFADGLHLNHTGRPIFSERLAQKLEAVR
jgi:hypothetical protein